MLTGKGKTGFFQKKLPIEVDVPIPSNVKLENQLPKSFGSLADDPTWDDFQEECKKYRDSLDEGLDIK